MENEIPNSSFQLRQSYLTNICWLLLAIYCYHYLVEEENKVDDECHDEGNDLQVVEVTRQNAL